MQSIGVDELKRHTARILRQMQESGEEIQLTYRGRVVARLVPEAPLSKNEALAKYRADRNKLISEIAKYTPVTVDVTALVKEMRREF